MLSGPALPAIGSVDGVPLMYAPPVPAIPSLPTASAAYRGQLLRVESSTADDQLYLCRRLAAGTFEWKALLA